MSVYFNAARGRWMYNFQRDGARYSGYAADPDTGEPARSKRQAERIEGRLKARLDGAKAKGAKPAPAPSPAGFTMADALAYYAEHKGQHNRTWEGDIKRQIRELLTYFGPDTLVEGITEADVLDYVAWCREQPAMVNTGGPRKGAALVPRSDGAKRAPNTINGFLTALRAAFNLARKVGKVSRVPYVPRLDTGRHVPNPIRPADLDRIMAAAPAHLRDVITLCVMTGMRRSECLTLTWDQVDLDAGTITLEPEGTKANRGRTVYVNGVALEVLRRLNAARPAGQNRVILYRHRGTGRPVPVESVTTAWRATLKRAGLDGRYRFHDTRAAFCSYLAAKGVDPVHIKELAGHESITTTMRYVQASDDRLRAAVASLETVGTGAGGDPGRT